MATLDLSRAKFAFDMADPDVVGFYSAYEVQPTHWLFNSTDAHAFRIYGSNLTYDAAGHALNGIVHTIDIDLGNDDAASPDVTITGLAAPASQLDDGPNGFWRVLEGDDVIYGPSLAQGATAARFGIYGDGPAAWPGASAGGDDIIHTGDGYVLLSGDVRDVGSPTTRAWTADYSGGDDQILGLPTKESQTLAGDALFVHAGSRLTGGHDSIFTQSTYGSTAVGDAFKVGGDAGPATVIGGDDHVTAGILHHGSLVGDVFELLPGSFVRGGDDTLEGGELSETLVGDVYRMTGSRLVGGDDVITGNGGNDTIYGDSYFAANNTTITGGHDSLWGGSGDDTIVGDYGSGGLVVKGGHDRLYGEHGRDRLRGDGGNDTLDGGAGADYLSGDDGHDQLFGGTEDDNLSGGSGNDLLDGGAGADVLRGGYGNDTYFINDYGDEVIEGVGQGLDTVWSTLASTVLADNVEVLSFNGTGTFTGIGNFLANTIAGGGGGDNLHGGDGNDVLIGGAGADKLFGGSGSHTASYASASAGVRADLLSPATNVGDAVGDSYSAIENLAGSAFGDQLLGDDLANRLSGGDGHDLLIGRGGDDVLIGGAGSDNFLGGEGNDRFDFLALGEADQIADFVNLAGNNDTLRFEGDAFGLPDGALAANRFVANANGQATAASHRFVYETDSGILRYDANGSAAGGVTVIADLTNTPALTAADILIF